MLDWFLTHSPFVYLSQSLWRDEAFSVLVAEHSFLDIIRVTIGDYTPPLYYFLLKFWMIFFGRSEEAIRMLSFMFYVLTIWVGYKFCREIIPIKNKWFVPVATTFIALNPMLLYFAFEARTYSLVVLLVLSSMYFLMKQKWKWYIAASTLAIYAHPFSMLALIAQGIYVIFWERSILKTFFKKALVIALFYLPWMFVIVNQIRGSSETWYYPVTREYVKASLGSIFLGYEGTPNELWAWCMKLSVIIIAIVTLSFFNEKIKKVQRLLLVSFLFPLVLIVGFSFYEPIFTQRYLIYTVVSEIFLVAIGLFSISNRFIKWGAIVAALYFLLFFNSWYPAKNIKQDFQTPFSEINRFMGKQDIILNESALTFFNAEYYATYPDQVYLLQEHDSNLPNYVGAILIPRDKWLEEIPKNTTVFLLHEDGTYETIKS